MSVKRLYMYLFFISALVWSPCYGTDPCMFKLDINVKTDNNDANTQVDFTPFIIENSGSEVNGVTIDLGGDIQSARRDGPYGIYFGDPPVYYPRAGERIYRDFIFGTYPSGVTITLWGLGTNRDCNITIWAFDDQSTGEANRVANWYANGTYIFDTNFMGGMANWPKYEGEPGGAKDLYKYAFSGRGTTDYLGRIILTSGRDPESPEGQPFAFVNAIQVEPNTAVPFVPPKYAHHPVPVDGAEDVPVDVILEWKKGGYAEKHDVYLGTDEAKVTDANRSNPLGVLVSEGQEPNTYDPPELLDLNTTYYWRIDEVNSAPDYTIFKGEVWSFMTLPYFVMEDFDSYADNAALRNVWKNDSTSAEVSVETTIVRDGKSMKYWYKNNLPPYYSEAYVDIADLGIDDPNWLGIGGAQALALRFHVEPDNPFSEQMYLKLTDGDSPAKTAIVMYSDTNNVRLKQWNKWSIALTEFTDVNLANVARITIGFGDDSPGDANTVYFEDITLDTAGVEEPVTAGEIDVRTVYQELEGFGAAGGWEENWVLGISQPSRNALYDILFSQLGLDIYRLRNTYNQGTSGTSYMNNSAEIVAAAKQRNPSLKILISAWTPEASLKSNSQLYGGSNATLAKDANDPNNSPPNYYVYTKYAKWWADSLVAWGNKGVVADYAGMQNEPDYDASWDSCRFNPTEEEDSNVAGFNQAFEAVYTEIYSRMGSNTPKMLIPETAGFNGLSNYINNLIDSNHVYGYAHHLYNGFTGTYDNADGFIPVMTDFRDNYYGVKPLMQTEFSKGGGGDVTTFPEAMNLACLMHNSLVFENASAYLYWELFWQSPKGLVSFPSWGTYEINPIYYAFKHYSAFTDPGWYRVEASTDSGSLGDVRISAFKNPEKDRLTIVIINKSTSSTDLMLTLKGFIPSSSEIYRSSQTENWLYLGPYSPSLTSPAYSITTIHLTGTSSPDCDTILDAGYGLTSDIYPDCYVNHIDLAIITDNWLRTDCTEPDNCEGADFELDGDVDFVDFSNFAIQWLWCNDPEDLECIENW
jgi:glucuronoarabinoxylan endo-1,4-beta-xylanase